MAGRHVVLVTGASSGIGEACARELARNGSIVVCTARREDRLRDLVAGIHAAGGHASFVVADISRPEEATRMVREAVSQHGRLDAVVANAAIDAPAGLAWDIDDDHWRRIIDVNLNGVWWTIKPALIPFMAQRAGRIVIMSSVAARAGSRIYSPAYSAAKAGLLGLTVSLAVQLEPYGVLVNAITPGPTGNTGTPVTPAERAEYLAVRPLGFGGTEPIVRAVQYLLGPGGSWITGSVLNVSGGEWMGI